MTSYEKILCFNCNNLIDVTELIDDYHECTEEDTVNVVRCEICNHSNAIYYTTSIDFDGREATDEEMKNFN